MFADAPVPADLLPHEHERLVKLLAVHYAYPLPYPLAGAYFEELFANAVAGRRETRKLLFDVLRGNIGWSLKTHEVATSRVRPGETFEVVIQRCDILKDKSLSLDSPLTALGESILHHFNGFCQSSARAQSVDDLRAGFLIRDPIQRNFVFFQQRYHLYQPDEVEWRWANVARNSLMGYAHGTLVLRWYRSGTQLFGVYLISPTVQPFHIDWRRADLEETIAFFTREGITRIVE